MISVLIPVYNDDPGNLVRDLHKQLSTVQGSEIIICNDGSELSVTKKITALAAELKTGLLNFSENKGVIQSRISLASQAGNDWLLFLDADLQLLSENFIQQYLDEMKQGFSVVTGSVSYQEETPDCRKRLHWQFGRKRESGSDGFKTANFLIKKELFLKIPFFQTNQYGHEDSWMGVFFTENNIRIKRTGIAALHLGLEDNIRFLEKSIFALRNIPLLIAAGNSQNIASHIKILRISILIKKLGLTALIIQLTKILNPLLKKNLLSCKPSLKIFDLYRLGQLLRILR